MHENLKLLKMRDIANWQNEIIALQSKIELSQIELGLKSADKKPTPFDRFQGERDSAPSPFENSGGEK